MPRPPQPVLSDAQTEPRLPPNEYYSIYRKLIEPAQVANRALPDASNYSELKEEARMKGDLLNQLSTRGILQDFIESRYNDLKAKLEADHFYHERNAQNPGHARRAYEDVMRLLPLSVERHVTAHLSERIDSILKSPDFREVIAPTNASGLARVIGADAATMRRAYEMFQEFRQRPQLDLEAGELVETIANVEHTLHGLASLDFASAEGGNERKVIN